MSFLATKKLLNSGKQEIQNKIIIEANGLRIKDVKNAIAKLPDLPTMFVAFFISFNTLLYADFKFLFFLFGRENFN